MQQLCIKTEEKEIKTCAFTGHRNLGEDFSLSKLKKEIKSLILRGVDTFYNGMAMGFDLTAAEEVLKLKKKYPQIKLVACIPCYGQEKNFSEKDKTRYVRILKKADEKIVLSDTYFKGCMQNRDRYMADRADILLTYCKKEVGGTAFTVKYYKKNYTENEVIFL